MIYFLFYHLNTAALLYTLQLICLRLILDKSRKASGGPSGINIIVWIVS
jgi:hypothetical protein